MIARRPLIANGAVVGTMLAAGSFGMTARAQPPGAQDYAWTTVPFGAGGFIAGFAYHPREKGLLYTRTDIGGAYRYDPQARSWVPLLDYLSRSDGELMGVLALALDPQDPDKVYLACGEYLGTWAHDAAVLRSADRGRTWLKCDLPLKLGGNAEGRGTGERLQVDPHHGARLILGTNQNGLLISENGGASFTAIGGLAQSNVTLVVFDAASGQPGAPTPTVYVGVARGKDKGALLVSHDGAQTFAPLPGGPELIPQRAVIDAEGDVYVTFSNGLTPWGGDNGSLHKWSAKSGKWTDISPMRPGGSNPAFAYCGVDIDHQRPGTVVVSTMNRWSVHDDIYLSRDSGRSWKPLGPQARHNAAPYPWLINYMKHQEAMGHWIADVRIDPFNSDALIYGTGYGLWLTQDLGKIDSGQVSTFEFAAANLEETAVLGLVSPTGGVPLIAAMGDVSGSAWEDLDKTPAHGLFAPNNDTVTAIDCAELAPQFVVRATNGPHSGLISQDGGATWDPFPSTPRVEQDAKGYHSAGQIAISAKAGAIVWAPEKQTGYYSKDFGKTWNPSRNWPVFDENKLQPIADRSVEGVFYVYDHKDTIWLSLDGGASFQPSIRGLPKLESWQSAQMTATPGRLRDLWLAGPWGLLHSGGPQDPMAQVKGVDEAWRVTLGKAAPGSTYPAVYIWGKVRSVEGIYRSDDGGKTWVRINDDAHRYGSYTAFAADALEYGTVYIGPHGRGIIVGRIVRK